MKTGREQLLAALRVYLVTDERNPGTALLPVIEQALAGGVTAVQLRRKVALGREFMELGRTIRRLTREAGVLFFVNDRVDVAALVEADGVHIGQDDIPCQEARKLLGPDVIIGVSASTVAQARTAELDGADYLGVGAVYATKSKPDADYTGLFGLRDICQAISLPVVAIGGIGSEEAKAPIQHGAMGVAVVSAIMSASDPRVAAAHLRKVVASSL